MSDDEDGPEKPHEATQQKLDEARKKGEFPRSADLVTAAGYGGLFLAAFLFGQTGAVQIATALMVHLGQADRFTPLMAAGGTAAFAGLAAKILLALAPFFLLPAIAAFLALIALRTLRFTPENLAAKLSRISPIAGLKNKLGRKGLFEFTKSFAKLLIISGLLGLFLTQRAGDFIGLIYLSAAMAASMLMRQLIAFLGFILLITLAIGVVDYAWQRAEHLRKNRMSRQELMDEHKNAEGDPHLKAKRRQKAQEIAMNKMLIDVAKADVIIVNPTHYAVALRWDRGQGRAPVCVAKGVDEIAARIREKAAAAGVPLHRDPATARLLHAYLDIGQEISPDHYQVVAAAIRFSEKMRKQHNILKNI